MAHQLRGWWHHPDHFGWMSAYLAIRGLQNMTRLLMSAVVLTLGSACALELASPSGPGSPAARGVTVAVTACCAVMTLLWLVSWPNSGQSIAFVLTSNVCIGAACIATAPGSGMQCVSVFAALAGYTAVFHTSRILVITVLAAAGTGLTCAWQVVATGDPVQAVVKYLLLLVTVVAVPFAAQFLIQVLAGDALAGLVDPLTELPNRRGFYQAVGVLAAGAAHRPDVHVSVVMVDLDEFKRINDTAGHATGDRLLVDVGNILHRTRRSDSVIARIGGEEFVVAVIGDHRDAFTLAKRICRDISVMEWGVTASVGVAGWPLSSLTSGLDLTSRVSALVAAADRAMYEAKRAGGDRVHAADEAMHFEQQGYATDVSHVSHVPDVAGVPDGADAAQRTDTVH